MAKRTIAYSRVNSGKSKERRGAILFVSLVILTVAAPVHAKQHRSRGYGGFTPVGLGGYVAGTKFDCASINGDASRSRLLVPLSGDCAVSVPSPDGRLIARALPDKDGDTTLTVTGGLTVRGLQQPTVLRWNPRSTGFLLNDSEGSGQVSRLRYFHKVLGAWRESVRLDHVASKLYLRRYDCRGGRNSYTNVSGWNWTASGMLRAIVQEGVHSEGCVQPYEDRNPLFEVVGNPVTGRIVSAREIRKLD